MSGTAASPFRTRTVLVLIAAGLALMIGFLLVGAYGDRFERQRGNTPGPTSRYATGFQGLYRLIEGSGGSATLASGGSDVAADALLILTPNFQTSAQQLVEAMAGHEGPVLIVLPKWFTRPQTLRPGREERVAPFPADLLSKQLAPFGKLSIGRERPAPLTYPSGLELRPFAVSEQIQAIAGKTLATLIAAPDGDAVLAEVKSGVFVLADPDLLNNHGLARVENARAAIALIAALDPEHPGIVAFDTMLPFGAGGRNLLQLMFEPPFVGVTLALFAAFLLAGFATLSRFGPVRREARAIAFGKTALIDNIVSLARRADRIREAGPAYAETIRNWAALRLALPRALQGEALDRHLDRIPTATSYAEAVGRLEEARTEPDLLHAAQMLDDWRKEVKA
ncbi:DUF4350 domain-containing protein [Sphingomonas sp.]|uniref:DUF4350 domain-containing protein n=1 Tax=Sphingomonas sp. TaxID=28214 RepID=UPI001EC7B4E0|nr:DUF4350 domain-containing protein [Sphingomonas sp.]MBX3594180.1 hypothetical protein [Sphingomonas sp.]